MKHATLFPLASLLIFLLLTACGPSTESVLELLPQDSTYSTPAGSGGSYKDPVHQFFQVQDPRAWGIKVRLDKAQLDPIPVGPDKGRVLLRSWVEFHRGDAAIEAIAREALADPEEDSEVASQESREKGAKIRSDRVVTIDGVEGREVLMSTRGNWRLDLRYQKGGLDHSLSLSCPSGEFLTHLGDFVAFARSYKSLQPASG